MKKLIALILAMSIFLVLTACGKDDTVVTTASTEPSQNMQEIGTDKGYDTSVTLEETVILSGDLYGVRIVATGMGYGNYGPHIKLTVENNTDRNIKLELGNDDISDTVVVNGIMIPCADIQNIVNNVTVGYEISAGEKVDALILFTDQLWLRDHGITKIASVQYDLRVLDFDTSEVYTQTSGMLRTSAFVENMPEPSAEGTTVYEQDGLKVVDMGMKDGYYHYCIDNGTENYLWVEIFDVVLNGQAIGWGSYFNDFYVYGNACCFEDFECTGWDGLENVTADDDVQSLEYKLRIWNVPASSGENELIWESGTLAATLN